MRWGFAPVELVYERNGRCLTRDVELVEDLLAYAVAVGVLAVQADHLEFALDRGRLAELRVGDLQKLEARRYVQVVSRLYVGVVELEVVEAEAVEVGVFGEVVV